MAAKRDRWDDLEAYVSEIQTALNVAHWKVSIARDASDVDAWADINPHEQNHTAELRISHDFCQTPEMQREVLTHEMLHLVTARLDQTVEALEDAMGKVLWAVFEPQYENATERAVDQLARVIAPFIPLPDLPKA
jgi:hypothetical protein